jgi:hypothetical protein
MGKEVTVRVHNEIGVLAQLSKLIADKGINILAVCAWVEGEEAVVRLVTNDNLRVMDALRENHYNPREAGTVMVETAHKPGILRRITERLSEKSIDLHHLYATAPDNQDRILIVFASANNDQAIVLLNA